MIKVTAKEIIISVFFGLLITFGYLGNMEVVQYANYDCAYSYPEKSGSTLAADCSGLSYGYPQRYVNSEPSLEYQEKNGQIDTTTLMVSSKVNFDIFAFVTNLVIWSGVSFAVLTAVHILLPKNKNASKSKK